MLQWIRCFLLLSIVTTPLSGAQAVTIDLVAYNGQNPDFRFHTLGNPAVDAAGRVFFGALFGSGIGRGSNGRFVWENGVVSPSTNPFEVPASLPISGDPIPGVPGATFNRTPSAKINRNGAAVVIQERVSPNNRLLVYDASGTGSLLGSTGDTAPGTGGRIFSKFYAQEGRFGARGPDPDLNDRGDLVFQATVAKFRPNGEPVDTGTGIWTVPATAGSIQPLVLSGSTVPGEPSLTFQQFTRTEIDAAGRIAFLGDFVGLTERTERALFFAGPDGDITLSARQGDLLPGGSNDLRLGELDELLLTDAGLAVMTANTIDGSGNVGAAVVTVTSTGELEVLLRTGQEILVGDRLRTVSEFSFFGSFRGVTLPDLGLLVGDWLTLAVEFEIRTLDEVNGWSIRPDGEAILRIRVPEPALVILLLIAAATARRVRG